MKIRLLLPCLLLLWTAAASAQTTFLWPIKGASAGENMLSTPQSYIDNELNFGNLFIGAKEGTPVLSPAEGTVTSFGAQYQRSLKFLIGNSGDTPIAAQMKSMAGELSDTDFPKFISAAITIRLSDGRKIHISGFVCDRNFKTGEKIARGQELGKTAYSYHKIKEPSIQLSISTPKGTVDDPMTPFGIKTSFIAPGKVVQKDPLTKQEATEDFNSLTAVLREAYPGLYDILSEKEFEAYCSQIAASIPDKIALKDFHALIKQVVSKIHDSHLSLYSLENTPTQTMLPQIYFGFINGELVATRTTQPYAPYYGRKIVSVDGISADSIGKMTASYIDRYDSKVESVVDYYQAMGCANLYHKYAPGADRNCDATIVFAPSDTLRVKGWVLKPNTPADAMTPNWLSFIRTNRYPKANFKTEIIDDTIAYLGLSTFGLNQVEEEKIAEFIRSAADKPNMIVDLRNNPGGDVTVLNRLLSYFTTTPFLKLGGYLKVNKQGNFTSFANCMNYTDDQMIFPEYTAQEGKTGFFSHEETAPTPPDSLTHYPGRLYVLINEGSCSAATVFPATILRNHRGVIVGRETSTAYHFMNALKFADIRLPHSMLQLRVPLVQIVFDTTVHPRIPYGRGVIPDHQINLSLDEMAFAKGDSILNYTLSLIRSGSYLDETSPFEVVTLSDSAPIPSAWLWTAGVLAVAAIGSIIVIRRRKKA